MKKISTSNIVENVRRQPFNKASYEHIQEAFQDVFAEIMKGLTENTGGVVILHGCLDSDPSATAWTISAGAALYNGEIFPIDAFTGTHATQVPVLSIETTHRAGDPVTFSDNNTYNVHEIRKLKWAMAVSGSAISDFSAVKRFKDHLKPNNRIAIYRNAAGVESTVVLKTKIVEIGDWDMDTTTTMEVPHGLSNYKKIRHVKAIVREDSDQIYQLLDSTAAGTANGTIAGVFPISNGAQNIVLNRLSSGAFDTGLWNATGFNRGWIHIEYEE